MNKSSTSLTPATWVRQQVGTGSISWRTFVKMMGFIPAASDKYGWPANGAREAGALLIDRLDTSYDLSSLPFADLVSGKTLAQDVPEPPKKGRPGQATQTEKTPVVVTPPKADIDNAAGTAEPVTPEVWLEELIGDRPIDWHTFQKLMGFLPSARGKYGWTVEQMRAVRAVLLDRLRSSGYDITGLPYKDLVDGKKSVTEVTPPAGGQAPNATVDAAPRVDADSTAETDEEAADTPAPGATTKAPAPDAAPPAAKSGTPGGGLPVPETLARSLYRSTEEVLSKALVMEQQGDFDGARKLVAPQIARLRPTVPQLRQDDPQANKNIIAYLQDKLDRYDGGTLPGSPAQSGVTAHRYNNTTVPLPATPGATAPIPGVTAPKPGVTAPKPGVTAPKPGATTPKPTTTAPAPGDTPNAKKAILTPQQWVQRQIGTRTLTWQDFGKQMGFTHQAQIDHGWSDTQLTWVREQLVNRLEQSGYDISTWLRNELITNNTPFNTLEEPPRSGTGAARGNYKALINRYFGSNALLAEAIMLLESSGDPNAINRKNKNGSIDTGLWQINSIHWGKVPGKFDADKIRWLQVPENNANMAVQISGGGQNWLPWSTYKKYVPGDTLAEKAAWLKQPGNKDKAAARVIAAAGLGQPASTPPLATSKRLATGTGAPSGTITTSKPKATSPAASQAPDSWRDQARAKYFRLLTHFNILKKGQDANATRYKEYIVHDVDNNPLQAKTLADTQFAGEMFHTVSALLGKVVGQQSGSGNFALPSGVHAVKENADVLGKLVRVPTGLPHVRFSVSEPYISNVAVDYLRRAGAEAGRQGYSLEVYSAYRNIDHQRDIWNKKLAELKRLHPHWSEERIKKTARHTVAPPGGSPHHSGGAVDIRLIGKSGKTSDNDLTLRRTLETIMLAQGWTRYHVEYWHFEVGTPRWSQGPGTVH